MYIQFYQQLSSYLDWKSYKNLRELYIFDKLKKKWIKEKTQNIPIDFKCFKCNNELIKHNADELGDCCDIIYENNVQILYCIDGDHWSDFFICTECYRYYFSCKGCSKNENIVLCQFIGHCGKFKEEKLYSGKLQKLFRFTKDIDQSLSNEVSIKIKKCCTYLDDNIYKLDEDYYTWADSEYFFSMEDNWDIPDYDVSDKDIFYFNVKGLWPTGQNGDDVHIWKCVRCNGIYQLGDK